VTNPPFGGEEERGIQGNLPDDHQTAETALLFLQLIMRRLKRNGKGRAAVVVPESVMSDTGVAQRIRRQLSEQFNLHTIVRLPKGVFEPYSDIQTNLLFFDTSHSTDGIWFYQVEVGGARQAMRDPKYTITSPIVYDEFLPIIEWFRDRKPTTQAWFVPRSALEDRKYSYDFRNPNRRDKDSSSIVAFAKELDKAIGLLSARLPIFTLTLIE
jgi:type I restriction enzyme M protein